MELFRTRNRHYDRIYDIVLFGIHIYPKNLHRSTGGYGNGQRLVPCPDKIAGIHSTGRVKAWIEFDRILVSR